MELELVTIHLGVLICTAVVILYSDHQGYLYFTGKKQILSERFLKWSHRLVWVGLLLMITTGILLAIPSLTYRLQQPIFYVKMGFVAVLVINAFAIGKLARLAMTKPFVELTKKEQYTLLISGALSGISWVSAGVIGYFFL